MIYIPCKEKQEWGATTSARAFFRERNERIYETYKSGMGLRDLARSFSLSEKSIQRILRDQRFAVSEGIESKNLTIYERTNPGRIPMELFECFMNNDMDAATEYGRNIDFLKKNNAEFM